METNLHLGFTPTEKILTELSKNTFLNFWSYNNPFYKKSNKLNTELCDLVVICDNTIILFSDKEINFSTKHDEKTAWERWHRKAIKESIKQLKGAERVIRRCQNGIYQDEACTKLLPIKIFDINTAKIHLIVVANGVAEKCKEYYGGHSNGSLVYNSDASRLSLPFVIGDENSDGTFVHILDSFTLPILLNELDTFTDLVQYLTEKENFLRSGKLIVYAGEEELLAYYFKNYDQILSKHGFLNAENHSADIITIDEGMWASLKTHPQYIAKKEADKESYLWDRLITQFTTNMLAGTLIRHGASLDTHEGGVRYMALEPRIHRRVLSKAFIEMINSYDINKQSIKINTLFSSSHINTTYILIQFPFVADFFNYQHYQERRLHYLRAACFAAKAKYPNFTRVIGIIMEPPLLYPNQPTSESMVLLDCSVLSWTQEMQDEGMYWSETLHIFQFQNMTSHVLNEKNFPDV